MMWVRMKNSGIIVAQLSKKQILTQNTNTIQQFKSQKRNSKRSKNHCIPFWNKTIRI